jgi:hypothetical protein
MRSLFTRFFILLALFFPVLAAAATSSTVIVVQNQTATQDSYVAATGVALPGNNTAGSYDFGSIQPTFWWGGVGTDSVYRGDGVDSTGTGAGVGVYVAGAGSTTWNINGATSITVGLGTNAECVGKCGATLVLKSSTASCIATANSPITMTAAAVNTGNGATVSATAYTKNLTDADWTVSGCANNTIAGFLALPLKEVHAQLLQANMQFTTVATGLYANGLNLGGISFAVTSGGTGGSLAVRPLPAIYSANTKAINYSAYRAGGPGVGEIPTDSQITEDLTLLNSAGYTLLRLFDTDISHENILRIAAASFPNLKFQLGIYLAGIAVANQPTCANSANDTGVQNGIREANAYSNVVSVSIGNETSFFSPYMPVSCLAGYITTVKQGITQPVTADDDYTFYTGSGSNTILPLLDFVSIHTYPMSNPSRWTYQNTGSAAAMMNAALANAKASYDQVATYIAANGGANLPIVVGETGWKATQTNPNNPLETCCANPANAKMYYDAMNTWQAAGTGPKVVFYFEAFDEAWKGINVTPFDDGWGIWDASRAARYALCDNTGVTSKPACTSPVYSAATFQSSGTGTPAADPTVNPPTPTQASTSVISVYGDHYGTMAGSNWNPGWGQATVGSEIVVSGNHVLKLAGLNYQGLEFAPTTGIDVSGMTNLHLDIWAATTTAFDVFLISPGPVEKSVTINPSTTGWNSIDIPLSSYTNPTPDKTHIFQLKFVGTPSGNTVYLDNIYFWAGSTTATVPGAPTIGTAAAGNAQATVSFTAPANNGGSAITGYTVTSNPSGGVDSNAGQTGLSHTITGLANGTSYTFTVHAANTTGNSAESAASNAVTPSAQGTGSATPLIFSSGFTSTNTTAQGGSWGYFSGDFLNYANTYTGGGFANDNPPVSDANQYFYIAVTTSAPTAPAGTPPSSGGYLGMYVTYPGTGLQLTGQDSLAINLGVDANFFTQATNKDITVLIVGAQTFNNGSGGLCNTSVTTTVTPTSATMTTYTIPLSKFTLAQGCGAPFSGNFTTAAAALAQPIGAINTQLSYPNVNTTVNSGTAGAPVYATGITRGLTEFVSASGTGTGSGNAIVTFDESPAPTFVDFGLYGTPSAVVTDPAGGTNKVAKVYKNLSTLSEQWGGTTIALLNVNPTGAKNSGFNAIPAIPFTATNKLMTLKAYSPAVGIRIRLKVENASNDGQSVETDAITTVANAWETLTFNFANPGLAPPVGGGATAALNLAYTYNKVSVFPDFGIGNGGSGPMPADRVYYFDDLAFVGGGGGGTATIPGSPTNVAASAGNAQASVSFTAPANTGGSAITGYVVTSIPAGGVDSNTGTTALTHTITGLTNGTSYTFTVHATNSTGTSVESAASNAVTPAASAGPVTSTAAEWALGGANDWGSVVSSLSTTPPSGGSLSNAAMVVVAPLSQYAGTTFLTIANAEFCSATHPAISLEVYAPNSGEKVRLKVEQDGNTARYVELDTLTTKAGWQTLSFNCVTGFATAGFDSTFVYNKMSVLFDVNMSPSTSETWYFDSLTYTPTAAVTYVPPAPAVDPTVKPAAPTHPNANIISVFGNTYGTMSGTDFNLNPNWSQTTAVSQITVAGDQILKYATLNYQGTNLQPASGINVTGMTNLHLDVWSATAASLKVSLVSVTAGEQAVTINPTSNGWNSIDIPLSQYTTIDKATIYQLKIENAVAGNNGNTIYLDNIYFWTGSAAATAPGAPTSVTATGGNAQAMVSFTAPANNGGSAITGYTVKSIPAGGTDSNAGSNALTHTITGLTNGTSYTFTVHAINAIGNSAESAASNAVTPSAATNYAVTANASLYGSFNPASQSVASGATTTFTVSANSGYVTVSVTGCGGNLSGNTYTTGTITGTCAITATFAPTATLVKGWNLMGNSSSSPLDVTKLGDATQSQVTTVWKWVPGKQRWAFYTPAYTAAELLTYANGKGYDVLSSINGGEGFWVNASAGFQLTLPVGSAVLTSTFGDSLDTSVAPNGLPAGWSLIAVGDGASPRAFVNAVSVTPPANVNGANAANSLISMWAWDSATTNWYFYAPNLDNSGGLVSYITSKLYEDFAGSATLPVKILSPTTGFWVNHP